MLGDSNLKLELPYGVQEHSIDKAVVHENYDINDSLHRNDTFLNGLCDCCLGVVNVTFLAIVLTANIFCGWGVLGHIGEVTLSVNLGDKIMIISNILITI